MRSATSYSALAEPDLFDDINTFARHTGWLHTPMYDIATYGVVVFGVLLVGGWWAARQRDDARAVAAAIWAGAATLIAVAVNQPIVNAVAQARPYTDRTDILVLAHRSTDYGFPSDHAVMAGAAAAGLLLYSRWIGTIAAGAAVILAFSRVYIAAHYPHDVIAGLALGAAVAALGWWLVGRPLTVLVERVSATGLRPLMASARRPGERGEATGIGGRQ